MLVDFPIFGAGINYFPTEISALRVFEPRYLLLIGDAIKEDRNFIVSKNLEDLHQTVSEVRIIEHQDISNAEQLIIIECLKVHKLKKYQSIL
jgi:Lon protease-like protein